MTDPVPSPASSPMLDDRTLGAGYAAMSRESGGFAMVALDQRGSLEALFRHAGRSDDARTIDAFRSAAVDALAPLASAVLLERGYLTRRFGVTPWTHSAALIVAADELTQRRDGPVESTTLDPPAGDIGLRLGATALKLLVMWSPATVVAEAVALARDFVDLAHTRALLAVVEVILTGPRGPREGSARQLLAAAELMSQGADIYKAQVPMDRGTADGDIETLSQDLTAVVSCPWVVLSNGVEADAFPGYVAAACRGGASGFLAGRGVWAAAIQSDRPEEHLRSASTRVLGELSAIVDAEARPWQSAVPDDSPGAAGLRAGGDTRPAASSGDDSPA